MTLNDSASNEPETMSITDAVSDSTEVEPVFVRSAWLDNPEVYTAIHEAPYLQFTKLHKLVKGLKSRLVFLKVRKTFIGNQTINETYVDLSIGKMYYVVSLNMTIGYLFELPKFYVRFGKNYLKAIHPDYKNVEQYDNVKRIFINGDLAIYNSEDKAVLVTLLQPFINMVAKEQEAT